MSRTFLTLSPEGLGKFIMGASERVIYAAPSLSDQVSTALINASERLGFEAVSVVLNVSEEVFRLGYGLIDALNMCREASIPSDTRTGSEFPSLSSTMLDTFLPSLHFL